MPLATNKKRAVSCIALCTLATAGAVGANASPSPPHVKLPKTGMTNRPTKSMVDALDNPVEGHSGWVDLDPSLPVWQSLDPEVLELLMGMAMELSVLENEGKLSKSDLSEALDAGCEALDMEDVSHAECVATVYTVAEAIATVVSFFG
jgi:hypothetical protein